MDKMIAFCGIICTDCPAFIATQKNDDAQRGKVADDWSKMSPDKAPLKPEHINCDGCLSTGQNLFNYCETCEIRKCGLEKGMKNCAYCHEYICEKLNNFFGFCPDAKKNLEAVRKGL